jgi:hypothetical protein
LNCIQVQKILEYTVGAVHILTIFIHVDVLFQAVSVTDKCIEFNQGSKSIVLENIHNEFKLTQVQLISKDQERFVSIIFPVKVIEISDV